MASNYLEDELNDAVLKNGSYAAGANVYVSLHTADAGETGSNECTGGSYGRQTVAAAGWNTSSGGVADNTSAISFAGMPAVTAPGVVAAGLWDASTGGNFLEKAWLTTWTKPKAAICVDTTNNDLICQTHGLAAGDVVVIEDEDCDTIPTGLTAGTVYYVIATGLTTDQFRVSATSGGSSVDITAKGGGVLWKLAPQVVGAGNTVQIAANAFKVRRY